MYLILGSFFGLFKSAPFFHCWFFSLLVDSCFCSMITLQKNKQFCTQSNWECAGAFPWSSFPWSSSETALFVILMYNLPLRIWQLCFVVVYHKGLSPGAKQCHSFNWKCALSTVAHIYITNYTQRLTFLTLYRHKPLFSSFRCDPYCRPNRQRKCGPVPKRWPWIMLQILPQADEGQ